MTKPITAPEDIRGIFAFLEALREAKIHFSLRSSRDDSIAVAFIALANKGDVAARRCLKLLGESRFRK